MRTQCESRGFTYLMLLWWVAVSSVLLAALGQNWAIEARRQREMELVFRGEQIRAAIQSYRDATPGAVKRLPTRLEDLLEDTRGPKDLRHLRRLWPDPITGSSQWGEVRDGDFIVGVYSRARQQPLRAPANVSSYEEWRFVAEP
ncbi:MAG: type II secretion system protein [Rubrivivax sp.]|nr:MAG: type II secretion system protein [Rubrivivax sp.]